MGAMYAAEHAEASIAEASHWLYHGFWLKSAGLENEVTSLRRCLFEFVVKGDTVDLLATPYDADAAKWMHPSNYAPCQEMGSAARAAGIPLIRYASVRDAHHRPAMAVMHWSAIACTAPLAMIEWDVFVGLGQVVWTSVHGDGNRIVLEM